MTAVIKEAGPAEAQEASRRAMRGRGSGRCACAPAAGDGGVGDREDGGSVSDGRCWC